MTPLSAELIAAPAALMVLLALMWFRRNRGPGVDAGSLTSDEGSDGRFARFVSSGRRDGRAPDASFEELAVTGVFDLPEAVHAPADESTPADTPVVEAPVEDAVFGPTPDADTDTDEPDWDAMRLHHPPAPVAPERDAIAEVYVPEVSESPSDHDLTLDELITRPGWPLPGDLDAWENTDLEPLVGAGMGAPSVDLWAEIAAEGPEEPSEGTNAHTTTPSLPAGAEPIALGAPYLAPALAPPTPLSELISPPADDAAHTLVEPVGGSADHGGVPPGPGSDPSFWDVGGSDASDLRGGDVDHDFDATHASVINGSDAWPPPASNDAAAPWAASASDVGEDTTQGETTARELASANATAAGAGSLADWWSTHSTPASESLTNDPSGNRTADPAEREFGQADQVLSAETWMGRPGDLSGLQRPGVPTTEAGGSAGASVPDQAMATFDDSAWWGAGTETPGPSLDDWWTAGDRSQPTSSGEGLDSREGVWANASVSADPHVAPVSTAGASSHGTSQALTTVDEILGSSMVASATGASGDHQPGPRLLPRLDASAHNRNTAGRFAVGGSAVVAGDGAFTRVRFRAPLDRPIFGWAIGDGPHHAPGTLVLVVDAVLNCSTAGLSVLQEEGDQNHPDGFTLSLSSDGPGPFAVSGSFYVVTGQ